MQHEIVENLHPIKKDKDSAAKFVQGLTIAA